MKSSVTEGRAIELCEKEGAGWVVGGNEAFRCAQVCQESCRVSESVFITALVLPTAL